MKKITTAVISLIMTASAISATDNPTTDNLRLLYWNIQNGMWDGQPDNYDRFVDFVKEQNPDVCVWCEAATIYKDGTDIHRDEDDCYLPDNWGELAARYGHNYWFIGGYRDHYPQVITSRYPIKGISQMTGQQPDSIVSHGAGWAQIEKNGHTVNIVTLHTWPHRFGLHELLMDQDARKASSDRKDGERYRRTEMEYVCRHTVDTDPNASRNMWLMMGDFNSKSSVDNYFYKMPADTTAFLVHEYVRHNTPYIDIIAEKYPGTFKSTIFGKSRIDFVYCTPPLYNRITRAEVIRDSYTEPRRDPTKRTNYCLPSDHCPILVDFDMKQ